MKQKLKTLFDVTVSPVRLVLFNIISFTVLILGFFALVVMLVADYGENQMPSLLLAYSSVAISIFIANVLKKPNLAAILLVSIVTFVLFPWMFFTGGAVAGGVPVYMALGMIFLFLLCDGVAFYILFAIQLIVYTGSFVVAYLHPELVIPLGDTADVYADVLQSVIIVSIVIGLINKFEVKSYENLIKQQEIQNQALKESEKRAELANRAKSDFLSNMSHEIRTPINAVIGMNEVIRREAESQEIREYAEVVNTSATALLSIINDILDFSKIESGKMTVVSEKYDLYSLINDSYNMVSDRAADKNLQLKIECDERLPVYLRGDIIRLRQIVTNLLTNAVKYTDEGTVTLKVRGDYVGDQVVLEISVSDTGIGMKEEDLERLFGKFERFDLDRNQAVEGTGLGLTIVKNLVELMRGTVSVESEYGKGSTFTALIPQKVESEQRIGKVEFGRVSRKTQEKYTPSIIDEKSRVLVVDDVQMNLLVFKKLIKDTKIQVDTAISGEECLEMIRQEKYDIIFMDHMMPNMSGIETFEAIRADYSHPNIDVPVVMLTANAIAGQDEEYLKMGFSDYISKPIDVKRLEAILRTYINNKAENTKEEISNIKNTSEANGASEEVKDIEKAEENVELDNTTERKKEMECNVDINAGIENCGGSKEFYLEILDSIVEEGKREALIDEYTRRDWKSYEIDVHALKGTLRLIGAMDAGEVAEKLQFAAEKNDEAVIDSLHDTLIEMYDISLEKIKAQL